MNKVLTTLGAAAFWALPFVGQAAAYQEMAVSNGGSISGTVAFAGQDTPPKIYKITKDNAVCGTGTREVDYIRVVDGKLMDSIVYLEKVDKGKPFPADLADPVVDHKVCEFLPFLQVMRNNTKLTSVNQDPILHNVHTYELIGRAKKTVFNVNQPEPSTLKKLVKLRRGMGMKVECDAHDFMHSFVFVARNPYFARVAEDGSYSIDNIPPGSYTAKVWHGTLKGEQATVEVTAGGTATVDFTVKK